MNKAQKKMLYSEGFLPREIIEFERAIGGDVRSGHRVKQEIAFNSKPFLAMRRSRRKYIANLRQVGWNDYEIRQKLNDYYRLGMGRSPFDYLKAEYRPARKLTDFEDATKRRIRSRLTRTLGKIYGRNPQKATVIRTVPKRPVFPNKPLVRRVRRYR
jgi:hypothetical protein